MDSHLQRSQGKDGSNPHFLPLVQMQLSNAPIGKQEDGDIAQNLGDSKPQQTPLLGGTVQTIQINATIPYADEASKEQKHYSPDQHHNDENIVRYPKWLVHAENVAVQEQDAQLDRGIGHFLDHQDRPSEL